MNLLIFHVSAILEMTESSLSAEEKYFLIRLCYWYECSAGGNLKRVVEKTIEELEVILGMSDNLIKKTRDSLIAKNYLTQCRVPSHSVTGKGRPRAGFALSDVAINKIRFLNHHRIHPNHIRRIERLLLWKHSTSGGQLKQQEIANLTPSNRILLAVLYSHASSTGMVNDLGVMRLAKLSGLLTKDRTETQLVKLTKLGYFLDRVSGMTGKYIFGMSNGAFFLNIFMDQNKDKKSALLLLMSKKLYRNRDYGHSQNWPIDKIFTENVNPAIRAKNSESLENPSNKDAIEKLKLELMCIENDFLERSVFDKISWIKEGDDFPYCSWASFISDEADFWISRFSKKVWWLGLLFEGVGAFHHRKLLQHKINYYASVLLTEHWDDVTQNFSLINPCLNRLKQDLFPTHIKRKVITDFECYIPHEGFGDILMDAALVCFYRMVFETALLSKGLIEWMCKDLKVDLSNATYTILSVGYKMGKPIENVSIVAKFRDDKLPCSFIDLTISPSRVCDLLEHENLNIEKLVGRGFSL